MTEAGSVTPAPGQVKKPGPGARGARIARGYNAWREDPPRLLPPPRPAERDLSESVLSLLRGEAPAAQASPEEIDRCLRRYECGGYLHAAWSAARRLDSLPRDWAEGIRRTHRKTVVDNLAALAEFRRFAGHLAEDKVPFILLKGCAYLLDLYPDPGGRMLTDIDLLIRRPDAGRVARRLAGAGYTGEVGSDFPENRRFEMWYPGAAHCRFELHWRLGLPTRSDLDQESIWTHAVPGILEGISCRRLAPEDAVLYHVLHAADHYFGPSLKWTLDLREMFRKWRLDEGVLLERARAWRCRTALHLALRQLDKVFPGAAPPRLLGGTSPGPIRSLLQRGYLSSDPLSFLTVRGDSPWRYPQRCLLVDRVLDSFLLTLQVMSRPVSRRLAGPPAPPWEWRD